MSGSNSSARADALPEPQPLAMTVHSVDAPTLADEDARGRTRRGRLRMLLVLLACAAPVIASYFTYFVIRPSGSSTAYGTLILPTKSLPDLALADLDGRPVAARSLRGQWLLVTLTAGVGGSLLSVGSAAGVAVMGQARGVYTFFSHLKWSWAILLGYAASIWTHFLVNGSSFS